MDILLVNSPVKALDKHAGSGLPLGLAYIAAVLRHAGNDVSVLDFNADPTPKSAFKNILEQAKPRILGISSHTETYLSGLDLAKTAKEVLPGIITVMGGTHPTVMYQDVVQEKNIDIVARGEGEFTMLELANYFLRKEGNLADIRGIAFIQDGTLRTTPERPFIKQLDDLPFPAREIFPFRKYEFPGRILASRGGCPFNCRFCAVNNIWKGGRRFRNPSRVIDEVIHIFDTLKVEQISFADDALTLNRQQVMELCALSESVNQVFPWYWTCATRVDLVDQKLLRHMSESGCKTITYGIEAGSQEILDSIGKGITLKQVREAVEMALDVGIGVLCAFMFPHPEDTEGTIYQQKLLMRELAEMGCEISVAFTTPYPGTYYFEHADEIGLKILADNWDDYDGRHLVIATRNLTKERLEILYEEMFLDLGMRHA